MNKSIRLKKSRSSRKNTIRSVPIPTSRSEVDAFLDDIFNKALDVSEIEMFKSTAKKLKNKIKGGTANRISYMTDEADQFKLKQSSMIKPFLIYPNSSPKLESIDSSQSHLMPNYYKKFYDDAKTSRENFCYTQINPNMSDLISFNFDYQISEEASSPIQAKHAVNKQTDIQARAKTIRIGKVRWPPPLKENETYENEVQR